MALSAALFASLVLQSGTPEVTAEEALRRSMERAPGFNVDAIIEQSASWNGNVIRSRLRRDAAGRSRTEVLSPLPMQGQVSVDDLKTWTTYFPDDGKMLIHPSPMTEADDLDLRMRLIRKNYRLEIDAKAVVAGRPALRVVATPVRAGLDTRRFYLDAATYASLKMETTNDAGVAPTFTVLRIEFPARFERSVFDAPRVDGARLDVAKPPVPLRDADDAENRLGFRPATPRYLPMGFRPQAGMTLWSFKGINPVRMRLTDGLVRLSVSQFRIPQGGLPPSRPGEEWRVARTVGDIRIDVRGDAPTAVREKILEAYASRLAARQKAQEPPDARKPKG